MRWRDRLLTTNARVPGGRDPTARSQSEHPARGGQSLTCGVALDCGLHGESTATDFYLQLVGTSECCVSQGWDHVQEVCGRLKSGPHPGVHAQQQQNFASKSTTTRQATFTSCFKTSSVAPQRRP